MKLTDLEAETAVIASIIQHGNSVYYDLSDVLSENTFTSINNQLVFSSIKYAIEKLEIEKLDRSILLSTALTLGINNIFQSKEGLEYLNKLFSLNVEIKNIRKLASKIAKLEIARRIYESLTRIRKEYLELSGDESINEILGIAENEIFNFSFLFNQSSTEPQKIFNNATVRIQWLKDNPRSLMGISTGLRKYDQAIGGGLRPGTVSVIGARAKAGKSILGNNVGIHIAKNLNIPVLSLDSEMRLEDNQDRLLALLLDIKIKDIETGRFGKNDYVTNKLFDTTKLLKDVPYYYASIGGMKFEEQISLIRRWIMKEVGLDSNGKANNCVIIYDYLKLMSAEEIRGDLKEYQILGFTMTALHNFALKFEVPILAFIQLNRDGITKESTDVASGSDRIIWLCSNFSIYKKKSKEEMEAEGFRFGNRKLVPIISRHGNGIPEDYININFKEEYAKVEEMYTQNEIKSNVHVDDISF